MGIVTNTVTTYAAEKSLREDFSDKIYNLAPTATVLLSSIGRGKAKQRYFEWQTDTLAAASTTNAVIEGDDAPAVDTYVPTNRVGNQTQISRKVLMVSGSEEAAESAGIKSQIAYQIAQKTKELKLDMEAMLCSDQVGVVGNNSTARKTAALGSWIQTNFYSVAGAAGTAPTMSSGGGDGYPSTAAADGNTPVAFTETHLKNMIQKVYTETGSGIAGSFVMVGPVNKVRASSFTGIATRFKDVPKGQAVIVGAADVYESDFGKLTIVPNIQQPENRVYLVNPEMAEVAYFRPFAVQDLAKTGDATKKQLIVEFGLKVKNEKAFGTVRGVTTSL